MPGMTVEVQFFASVDMPTVWKKRNGRVLEKWEALVMELGQASSGTWFAHCDRLATYVVGLMPEKARKSLTKCD